MIFQLNKAEEQLLQDFDIDFQPHHDYSEEEAFSLLDKIYGAEIFYAQDSDINKLSRYKADRYANLADKLQANIP